MNRNLVRRLFQLVKPFKGGLIMAGVALTLSAVSVIALGLGLRRLIDQGLLAQDPAELTRVVVQFSLLGLMLAAGAFLRTHTTARLADRVVSDLKNKLFTHLIGLNLSFYSAARIGDLMARMSEDMMSIRTVISASSAVALRCMLQLVGAISLLFMLSWKLTLLVLAMVPVVLLPVFWILRRMKNLTAVSQDKSDDVLSFAEEMLAASGVIQSFNQEAHVARRFSDLSALALQHAAQRTWYRSLLIGSVIALAALGVSLVFWNGGLWVIRGDLSLGQMYAFLFYALVLVGSVNNLAEVQSDMAQASTALAKIDALFAIPSLGQRASSNPDQPPSQPQPILLDHVHFSYPNRPETPVLEDFCLTILPGEHLALVGPSGAGKSTLLQLLLRFYDASEGKILYGQKDIQHFALQPWRGLFAYMPQDPPLFHGSIYDNIVFAKPEASPAEVDSAVKAAYVDEFLKDLPLGLATPVGRRGVQLSGGQRQRIALARVILRDVPILLLDEATNALDAQSEHRVQEALAKYSQGRTTVTVAHRLSTVLKADRIVVVDGGRKIAEGNHEGLLRSCPLYESLAAYQFVA
ncbi:MAG: ABC transporter ATP-binding protein [Holosporales bacterium]